MDKKEGYSKREIVKKYEYHRFGGKSGSYVNNREKNIFKDFLNSEKGEFCLDLACGTGRFVEVLSRKCENVVGTDYSINMLKQARKQAKAEFVRSNAFSLPFRDEIFDVITIGRLFQHYKNIEGLLLEVKRILKNGGVVIFDFLKWSPWNIYPSSSPRKIFRHNNAEIKYISKKFKLKIEKQRSCFLFAPGIYRFLPFSVIKILNRIEERIPKRFLVRSFCKLRKIN